MGDREEAIVARRILRRVAMRQHYACSKSRGMSPVDNNNEKGKESESKTEKQKIKERHLSS